MNTTSEYTFDSSHEYFITEGIKDKLKATHKKKVIDFGATEVEHLSGKTFKLYGTIFLDGAFSSKIEEKFECIATARNEGTNIFGHFTINSYEEK